MKIKEEPKDGIMIFHLSGKVMGGDDATMFHGKVHECIEAGKRKVVIDLGGVEWMNSSGIGMLISTLTTIKNNKGEMRLADVDKIQDLLILVGVDRIMKPYDTVEEAIKSF